jgi:hypothetical protein
MVKRFSLKQTGNFFLCVKKKFAPKQNYYRPVFSFIKKRVIANKDGQAPSEVLRRKEIQGSRDDGDEGVVVVDWSRDNGKEGDDDPRSRDGLEQQRWPGAEMEVEACLNRDGE